MHTRSHTHSHTQSWPTQQLGSSNFELVFFSTTHGHQNWVVFIMITKRMHRNCSLLLLTTLKVNFFPPDNTELTNCGAMLTFLNIVEYMGVQLAVSVLFKYTRLLY